MSTAGKNLKKFRNFLDVKQKTFAESIETPQSHVSNIEVGSRNITENLISKISNRYSNLNMHWLFTSQGEMLLSERSVQKVSEPDIIYSNSKNILIPYEDRASYGQITHKNIFVNIPTIEGEARTFEVRGDSMYPYIQDRDYVACTPIQKAYQVLAGEIYVIVTISRGILMKFATFIGDALQLHSSSKEVIRIELNDVREIWIVKCKLTSNITPVTIQYEERLKSLETKFNNLLNKHK